MIERMHPDTEAMAAAARNIAWANGLDPDTLESIVRRVAGRARHTMLIGFLGEPSNDEA